MLKLIGISYCNHTVFFETTDPQNVFRYYAPEGFGWGEGNFITKHAPIRCAMLAPLADFKENEYIVHATDYQADGYYRQKISVADYGLRIELTVQNRGKLPVKDLRASQCLSFRYAEDFYPRCMERAFLRINGRFVRIADSDLRFAKNKEVIRYLAKGSPIPQERVDRMGWGYSDDQPDEPFIGLEDRRKKRTIATFWEEGYEFLFNSLQPYHGCMHVEPYLGGLAPGEQKTARGCIVLINGNIEEAYAKYIEIKKTWAAASS